MGALSERIRLDERKQIPDSAPKERGSKAEETVKARKEALELNDRKRQEMERKILAKLHRWLKERGV